MIITKRNNFKLKYISILQHGLFINSNRNDLARTYFTLFDYSNQDYYNLKSKNISRDEKAINHAKFNYIMHKYNKSKPLSSY